MPEQIENDSFKNNKFINKKEYRRRVVTPDTLHLKCVKKVYDRLIFFGIVIE